MHSQNLTILGIETSCDETAIAIVRGDGAVLSSQLRSQNDRHAAFGGVVPEIAARAHLDILPAMLDDALREADIALSDINAIGATAGPGLIGGLLVGAEFARSLGYALNVPVYGLNHLEGHALTARLTDKVEFPFLLLLVSGGHSQFLIVESVGQYRKIGGTMDDAVGEAFDKAAKLLGLGYPGGPLLERLAESGDARRFALPIPLQGRKGCDLSLSGLKTAVRHAAAALPQPVADRDRADLAASFQYSVLKMLEDRLQHAMDLFRADHGKSPAAFALAGGVAANRYLHAGLQKVAAKNNFSLIAPPLDLCGDNAVMMAWTAIERIQAKIPPTPHFTVRPRWPLSDLSTYNKVSAL